MIEPIALIGGALFGCLFALWKVQKALDAICAEVAAIRAALDADRAMRAFSPIDGRELSEAAARFNRREKEAEARARLK